MESGIFVTFFEPGAPFDRELPPVGPLDHVVVRPRQLVADRAAAQQAHDSEVAIDRWLEAELELQRAVGEEPGGPKRSEMRITATEGVFLRFAVFGDERERDLVPELGPFAVVVVGKRSVEADGHVLATRAASELAPWELASPAGRDLAGVHKPDIAVRSAGGGYHRGIVPVTPRTLLNTAPAPRITITPDPPPITIAPAPQITITPERRQLAPEPPPIVGRPEPPPIVASQPPPAAISPTPPPPAPPPRAARPPAAEPESPALTADDLALIERMERQRDEEQLRARMQEEERRRLGVDENEDASTWAMRYRPQPAADNTATAAAAGESLDLRVLLWRMRFALIGVLVIALGAYGLLSFRNGGAVSVTGGGSRSFQTVGIAQKFSSDRWDYIVNGVQRVLTSGTSRARGTYYVVRIGVTNRGTEGAQLSPSSFTLYDANGTQYTPSGLSSGAYYGDGNTSSQYVWPQSFPVGKTTAISIIFDVDPGLGRGNQLAIDELPRIRVNLD